MQAQGGAVRLCEVKEEEQPKAAGVGCAGDIRRGGLPRPGPDSKAPVAPGSVRLHELAEDLELEAELAGFSSFALPEFGEEPKKKPRLESRGLKGS